MRRWIAFVVVVGAALAAPISSAAAKDYARDGAQHHPLRAVGAACRSIQTPTTQARMYDGLTPLFDDVSSADLTTYFKSERFGVGTDGPGTQRARAPRRA